MSGDPNKLDYCSAEILAQVLRERERLQALTNAALVAECSKSEAADYEIVIEMMNRLDPEWNTRVDG